MAITKCRIWVQVVNWFTVAARVLRQRGPHQRWMVRAGLDGDNREQDYY
jgi:hypothetical protein